MNNLKEHNKIEMEYLTSQVNKFCDNNGLLYKINTEHSSDELLRPIIKLYTNAKGATGLLLFEIQFSYNSSHFAPRWSLGSLSHRFDITSLEAELDLN